MKKDEKELPWPSALEEDILTLLYQKDNLTEKFYGLEILKGLNYGRPIPIGFGSLYPTLNRMKKKGLICCKWGDEQDNTGGARRKYYEITADGIRKLEQVQRYREGLARRANGGSLEPQAQGV